MLRRRSSIGVLVLSALIVLLAPAAALADTFDAAGKGLPQSVGINSMWVIVAGCLVMFMQAGFAFLEIGFSRGKNAGTVIAKIVTNFSIAGIMYWAVGFAFAFGGGLGHVIGTDGFFLRAFGDPQQAFPIMGLSDATIEAKWFFQFVFCAVSLAIVWGTTLERIKFGVYVIYAVVFSALIYPIGAHWIFGGGWLSASFGMQDFAGSTVVHLIGATGAVATMYVKTRNIDIGMAGNGAIAALVAITAPSGYVELWAAPIIGAVAGVIVVVGVLAIDKWIDDPVGALSAHGLAGIWGTISCGLFTSPRLASYNAVGDPGLVYSGSFHQLFAQILGVASAFVFVFALSFATFWAIKKTYGLRVTAEE